MFQKLGGQSARVAARLLKFLDAIRVWRARDAAEKAFVVQEIIAGQNVLKEKLFEQVTWRRGRLARMVPWDSVRPNSGKLGELPGTSADRGAGSPVRVREWMKTPGLSVRQQLHIAGRNRDP